LATGENRRERLIMEALHREGGRLNQHLFARNEAAAFSIWNEREEAIAGEENTV
jgi:hypothetical protein